MKPLAIAHRGYHHHYFENTKEAFIEASKMPFYGIETDIHLTKDLVWVTHHNDDIISGGKNYFIKDLTLEELMRLPLDNDLGHKNATVCLFSDYLVICKESGKRPIIEIKNSPKLKYLNKLVKYVDEFMGLDNVTFIAFYPWPLYKLKLCFGKRIHMQQLVQEHTELIPLARWFKLDIDMDIDRLTLEMVNKHHKRKLKVNVWTVNKKEQLDKALSYDVDYVTGDNFTQED